MTEQNKEIRTRIVNFWLTPSEYAALKAFARKKRWTLSQIIRDGLELVLAQEGTSDIHTENV